MLMMEPDRLAQYRRLLDPRGRVTRWPKKVHEKQFVLEYLRDKLTAGTTYTERQVNDTIDAWHLFGDHALLRREMFDKGLLHRTTDGRSYWI
jgi:hypothetical protein